MIFRPTTSQRVLQATRIIPQGIREEEAEDDDDDDEEENDEWGGGRIPGGFR